MKFRLTILFVIIFFTAKSQDYYYDPKPTLFDTFTSQVSITWAAYVNDRIKFDAPNLSEILINRMEKGEIKTGYPWDPILGDKIEYRTKEDNLHELVDCPRHFMYDSLGNIDGDTTCYQTGFLDFRSCDLLWLTQILFVENGKPNLYIPWVAPTFSYIKGGKFLLFQNYFSTSLNLKYNSKSSVKDKIIYLGSRNNRIVFDSTLEENTIKKTYGRNLLQSIWGQVMTGKNEVYVTETNTRILPVDLDYFIFS